LSEAQLAELLRELARMPLDGIVATNTTIERPSYLKSPYKVETGGLSGQPVRARSLAVLRALRSQLGPSMPIVGVGGIFTAQQGVETREAGADLLQLYTGLIYRGPALVSELLRRLASPSGDVT
jgi:dihydroorotate dehydrogenase